MSNEFDIKSKIKSVFFKKGGKICKHLKGY